MGQVGRSQPFQLHERHMVAYMYAEPTLYHYMEALGVPKHWLQDHVGTIVGLYCMYVWEHNVTCEDMFLGAWPLFSGSLLCWMMLRFSFLFSLSLVTTTPVTLCHDTLDLS